MAVATERKSAAERREEILEAALAEFALHGLAGGSTEAIAKAVGISQPYVFRLFGTKKELFMATVERCLRGTLELMRTASAGLKGEDVLQAIAGAYRERLANPTYLHAQMQSYAACGDPEIRDVVRRHRRYHKILRSTLKLYAHDEANNANEGDTVRVVECRPMSRSKRWRLTEVLERAK